MAKKTKNESQDAAVETTETIAFLSLPMKWRKICYSYASERNHPHADIMKMSFKIGKFDRTLHGIAEPVKI